MKVFRCKHKKPICVKIHNNAHMYVNTSQYNGLVGHQVKLSIRSIYFNVKIGNS